MPDIWWSFCTSLTKFDMMPFCNIKNGYNTALHVVICHSFELYFSVSLYLFFTCLSLQLQYTNTKSIISLDLSDLSLFIFLPNCLHTHIYGTLCFFCKYSFPVKKPLLGYMLIYLLFPHQYFCHSNMLSLIVRIFSLCS